MNFVQKSDAVAGNLRFVRRLFCLDIFFFFFRLAGKHSVTLIFWGKKPREKRG